MICRNSINHRVLHVEQTKMSIRNELCHGLMKSINNNCIVSCSTVLMKIEFCLYILIWTYTIGFLFITETKMIYTGVN